MQHFDLDFWPLWKAARLVCPKTFCDYLIYFGTFLLGCEWVDELHRQKGTLSV
jgi:hypothetical protein